MRIYLASGFSWRQNLRALAKNIEAKGHTITSSWIWLDNRPERNTEEWDEFAKKIAGTNLVDLHRSNCLVLDGRGIRKDGNGGAWSELGFALAEDWPVYFIGEKKTNTFLWMPRILEVTEEQLLNYL